MAASANQAIELVAMLSGASFVVAVYLFARTAGSRGGHALRFARPLVTLFAAAVAALAFVARSAPPIEALATVAVGLGALALAIDLTAPTTEPAWWPSFEESFWRHVGWRRGDAPTGDDRA